MCNDQDFDEFYPVASKSRDAVDVIRKNKDQGLYCIDYTDDLFVYGEETNPNY